MGLRDKIAYAADKAKSWDYKITSTADFKEGAFFGARLVLEELSTDRESVREILALMSEGEGSDPEIYRTMAKAALAIFDKLAAELGEL